MRRGEVWTVASGKDYAGKPCPVVIVPDDSFDATDSITICTFTTDPTEAPCSGCQASRTRATGYDLPPD